MIYDAIIGPYHYEYVRHCVDPKTSGVFGQPHLKFFNGKLGNAPSQSLRWWRDDYMGRTVATEMVTHWYRARTFKFSSRSLHLLPKFLAEDVFDKGLVPSAIIQRVQCHVDVADLDQITLAEQTEANLSTFSTIKNKKVNLIICIDYVGERVAESVQLAVLGQVIKTIARIVYGLPNQGFDRITVRRTAPWTNLTYLFIDSEEMILGQLNLCCSYLRNMEKGIVWKP